MGTERPKILWIGREFLASYFAPHAQIVHIRSEEEAHRINDHRDADFAFCVVDTMEQHMWRRRVLRRCHQLGIPRCLWNIEDPNAFGYYVQNVHRLDFEFVFTTDRTTIPLYARRTYRSTRVRFFKTYWLPLAASPEHHYPVPTRDDATDLVLVAQSYWYWPARRAAAQHLIVPLLKAGYSLRLFCPEGGWQEEPEIAAHRVGGECFTDTCGQHYAHGHIALGVNCQAGLEVDTFAKTSMTSMRTFEVLACGKPFLAYQSAAYEQLGFKKGIHFYWSRSQVEALDYAHQLRADPALAARVADQGRQFVLANHTYRHRIDRILRVIQGKAGPLEWN